MTNTPKALCPVITTQIPGDFLFPPPAAPAACSLIRSRRYGQRPGHLRGPVIALELPGTSQGKHAPCCSLAWGERIAWRPPSLPGRMRDRRLRGLRGLRRARWASSASAKQSRLPRADGAGMRDAGGDGVPCGGRGATWSPPLGKTVLGDLGSSLSLSSGGEAPH